MLIWDFCVACCKKRKEALDEKTYIYWVTFYVKIIGTLIYSSVSIYFFVHVETPKTKQKKMHAYAHIDGLSKNAYHVILTSCQ